MSSLLRSTKFVRYFTGAARTLILNSAKTVESNLLNNSACLYATNNIIGREYASSKKSESLEPLLHRLDQDVRRYGRILKKDLDEVFDEIKVKNDITSSQSLLVIRCCGELVPDELPEQRTMLVKKIWSVLTERGVPMDISHYNALLRVYIENEHAFSPAEFLDELEKKGLQPNRVTYQRLMWRYCQQGDVDGATKVLEKMRELGLPVSEPVLNALVMGYSHLGDTDGALAVLNTMAGAGLQPSNKTYTLLACGYAKKGDIDGVNGVLNSAKEKDVFITDKDILDVIEALAVNGQGDKVEQYFQHLQKGPTYNQDARNLILSLINRGHEDVAKELLRTMTRPKQETEEMGYQGAFFVKQLAKMNKNPEKVIGICRELQADALAPKAFFLATEAALQSGNTELAQELFAELKNEGLEIRQHYYWPILAKKAAEKDEEGLLQTLRNMSAHGVIPSGETLRDYVLPHLKLNNSPQNIIVKLQISNIPTIRCARNLVADLLESGDIKKAAEIALQYRPRGHYSLIARPLVTALNKTNDIQSFVTLLQVISSKPSNQEDADDSPTVEDRNDAQEVGKIVANAVKSLSDPERITKLLSLLASKGVSISTQSAESIEEILGENMSVQHSEVLGLLTSSDLESTLIEKPRIIKMASEFEYMINQAKSKGLPYTHLQRQLLSAYIREKNIEKTTSLANEMEKSGFSFTPLTLAQLLEFFAVNDDPDKAMHYKKLLDDKGSDFVLNNYKLVQLAFALIKADRFDEALSLFDKTTTNDTEVFVYNSKCWQMLNYLAEEKEADKLKTLTSALIERNYIKPSNILLGPLIKVYMLSDNIDLALSEFERCCKEYRSTPWKGEIMKKLIVNEDATKLQWLADLSTQIHGEVNTLHDLVLAFVECGRLRQARRILETPGLQAPRKRLEGACQRYRDEGKTECLEGLLEATRQLSNFDRTNIVFHLLVSYCNSNQTDKALELWTSLQEEGEIPSDAFLKHLAMHLKSQNKPVPFVLPTDIKILKDSSKKNVSTSKIEELLNDGKITDGYNMTMDSLQSKVLPKASTVKYLLKLMAHEGKVDEIKMLGTLLTTEQKRFVTYNDKLTLATIVKGNGSEHIDQLLVDLKTAQTDFEVEEVLKRFPRSTALNSLMNNNTEVIEKCNTIAELALKKGKSLPMNLLWIEYIIEGHQSDADKIWNSHLCNENQIAFRRLLQYAYNKKQPELVKKLIHDLKQNKNVTKEALGIVYSRLINIYLSDKNLVEAKSALDEAMKSGISLEHINRTTLAKLKEASIDI